MGRLFKLLANQVHHVSCSCTNCVNQIMAQLTFVVPNNFSTRIWLLESLMSGNIWASPASAGVEGGAAPFQGLREHSPLPKDSIGQVKSGQVMAAVVAQWQSARLMTCDLEVVCSNPAGRWAFFFFNLFSLTLLRNKSQSVFNQVPQRRASQ